MILSTGIALTLRREMRKIGIALFYFSLWDFVCDFMQKCENIANLHQKMIPEMAEVFMKVFLQRVDTKHYIWHSFLLILYLVHFSFNYVSLVFYL